jgi:DNA repair exonuclease SbcCD ATPase subunit
MLGSQMYCSHHLTAKERDEANNSPRIQNIEVEIRQIEDKWETIKRKQTELKMELDSLQESADAHTAIATLEEELAREFEMLEELVKDCSSLLCRFNLQDYAKLPSLDKDGQAVINTVERLETEISGKLNETQAQLDAATGAYKKQESLVSERNWALRGGRQSLQSLRQQIDRFAGEHCCLAVVQNVVNEIRKVDPSITIDEKSPHDILKYLDGQIAERVNSDEDLGDPEMIKAVM